MNKILTRIVGAVAGLAMVMGAGFAIVNNSNKQAKPVHADAVAGSFSKVTSSSLTAGDIVIFVNEAGTYACGDLSATSGGYGTTVSVNVANEKITLTASTTVTQFVVEAGNANGSYAFKALNNTNFEDKYLAYTSTATSKSNYLNRYNSVADQSSFTLTYSSTMKVRSVYNTGRWLRFNSDRFACYYNANSESTTGTGVDIWKKDGATVALTGLRISDGESSVKKVYEAGENFDPTGLVIQAKWDDEWDTEHNVLNSVTWTPSPLTKGTTSVTGTYSSGGHSETVTISGLTVTGPDVVLDKNNKPFTSTSSSNTDEENVTLDGIEYHSYAAYVYNSNYLTFNKSQSGAYLGNNTAFAKNIAKIVVNYYSGGASYFAMFEGTSALAESYTISPSSSGTGAVTYTFKDENQFFKLKLTTTGTYCNINSISIYYGSTHVNAEIDTVSATMNGTTYYAGETLSASDFNLTVTWTGGKADTHPTEDFTWTVNGVANGELVAGNNTIVVTYGDKSFEFVLVGTVPTAKYLIERDESTQAAVAYNTYNTAVITDSLDYAFVGVTGTPYTDWAENAPNSNAIYEGKTAGGNESIQLNDNDKKPGIVTTSSGGIASSITVVWNSNTAAGRSFEVYGKNEAYDSVADLYDNAKKGTRIATLTEGTNDSATFEEFYPFIGIKATGALYLDSFEIEWRTFTYEDMGIRFGGSISEALWNQLETESDIQGYGVFLSTPEYLNGDKIKDFYDLALSVAGNSEDALAQTGDDTNIKWFSNEHTRHEPKLKETPTLKGGNYVWNLCERISFANAAKNYVALAYIKIANDVVFLNEVTANMKDLAQDLIDDNPNYDTKSFGGSLSYLANA